MSNAVFDRIFDDAVPYVLSGEHVRDGPPTEGGRWPASVVCLPEPAVAVRLEEEMRGALDHAGAGHFLTGRRDAVHVTVRALETYRDAAKPTDVRAAAWRAALARTAACGHPFVLECTGLSLARGSLLLQLVPRDDAPWRLMTRLSDELGPEAWFEDQWPPRDIWYATLLHFAAPLADPSGLVDHVRDRRAWEPFPVAVDSLSLVRYRHRRVGDEQWMAPEVWTTEPLAEHPRAVS